MTSKLKRLLTLILTLAMTLSLASTVVWAIEPTDTSVTYFIASWNGSQVDYTSASTTDYTTVTDQTTGWKNGTYVVNSSVVVDSRITVSGTVNLILCDGASLNAKKGIQVNSGNTLNIYGQETHAGSNDPGRICGRISETAVQ